MGERPDQKVIDLLVEAHRETLKTVDRSLLLAAIAAAFILLHGLQEDYRLAMPLTRTPAGEVVAARPHTTPERKAVTIPVLGLSAQLLPASVFGLVLYWILTLRSAQYAGRAANIAKRLGAMDPGVLEGCLVYPSIVTGTRRTRLGSCVALGVLSFFGLVLMYIHFEALPGLLLVSTVMLIPPAFLFAQLRRNPPSLFDK